MKKNRILLLIAKLRKDSIGRVKELATSVPFNAQCSLTTRSTEFVSIRSKVKQHAMLVKKITFLGYFCFSSILSEH